MKNKNEKSVKLARKQWERAVDKALENDNESIFIKDARKSLFMGLFDDYVKEKDDGAMMS